MVFRGGGGAEGRRGGKRDRNEDIIALAAANRCKCKDTARDLLKYGRLVRLRLLLRWFKSDYISGLHSSGGWRR